MNRPAPEEFGRHSTRLKGYDYSQAGGYYITIVTQLRESVLGRICGEEMLYTDAGKMVNIEWEALQDRFPNIEMDVFQVMPNHVHGIIIIHNPETVGAGLACASTAGTGVPALDVRVATRPTTRVAPVIGEIVGAFKSITTHKYIQGVDDFAWPVFSKKLWQRNYLSRGFCGAMNTSSVTRPITSASPVTSSITRSTGTRMMKTSKTLQEKEMLQRDIESTDQAIDALVYQLYGLTQAEIKIVEAGA